MKRHWIPGSVSPGDYQESSQAKSKKEGTKARLARVAALSLSKRINEIRLMPPTPIDYAVTCPQVTVPLQMNYAHAGHPPSHKELTPAAAGIWDVKYFQEWFEKQTLAA